jgi:hypothetical protein
MSKEDKSERTPDDAESRAMKRIMDALKSLPSYGTRKRVIDYFASRVAEEARIDAGLPPKQS